MKQAIGILLIVIITAAVTKYYFPKIEEKTVVVEKIVTRTITRIVQSPDGTIVTEIDKQEDNTKKSTDITYKTADWFVATGVEFLPRKGYNVQINRRILGPVFFGISGSSNGVLGAQMGVEF